MPNLHNYTTLNITDLNASLPMYKKNKQIKLYYLVAINCQHFSNWHWSRVFNKYYIS